MARVATKLISTKTGGFVSRKRIPGDAQAVYEKRYGVRWEERLRIAVGTPIVSARAQHREWLSEIESRIANIRAERTGAGLTLTPRQARALSGEWYNWFVVQKSSGPATPDLWEYWREFIHDALAGYEHVAAAEAPEYGRAGFSATDWVWAHHIEARGAVRPMLADWGETARFLAVRKLALDVASRDLFLDHVYTDFAVATALLIRQARGDFTPDTYPKRFPKFDGGADAGLTAWQLFERWIAAAKPAPSTVDRWRTCGSIECRGGRAGWHSSGARPNRRDR